MPQSLRRIPIQKPKQIPKLIGRMQLADLMDLSEDEFKALIRIIEKTPLFRRLTYPNRTQDKAQKVISFTRYPETDVASRTFELKEEILPDRSLVDIETLLKDREDLVGIIRKLGMKKFEEYFLYCQHDLSLEELTKVCNMNMDEVIRIIDLMNEISFRSNVTASSIVNPSTKISCSKVASIEKNKNEFSIGYFDFCYARGKYSINYGKLTRLKEQSQFRKRQIQELDSLIKTLEMINARKNTLYRILQAIIKRQTEFLDTGNFKVRAPLTQKEIAQTLGINPSLISRAIRFKSVRTPWGEELPLRDFFPDRKTITKEFLKEVVEEKGTELTDKQLADLIKKQFGIDISRRSINDYRREINATSIAL